MKEQKENRMAVEPVGKLMLSMGIPMVLSMMLQAVYNIVDSAFVGGMKEGGEQALNALTLVSLALAAVFHLKKNTELSNGLRYLKPAMAVIHDIYAIGLPAIIAQALMSVMTFGLNIILVKVSEAAVTAYGLYYKVQQFILFAAFGLRDAITPIVSFNYGRQDRERIRAGIRYGLGYTLAVMAAGTLLLEAFSAAFAGLFGLSGTTRTMFISAMRIISVSFVFAVAWGLSLPARENPGRLWLVWLTFLIAEGISCLISVLFMRTIRGRKLEAGQTGAVCP